VISGIVPVAGSSQMLAKEKLKMEKERLRQEDEKLRFDLRHSKFHFLAERKKRIW
jgi:hypothetical protein